MVRYKDPDRNTTVRSTIEMKSEEVSSFPGARNSWSRDDPVGGKDSDWTPVRE